MKKELYITPSDKQREFTTKDISISIPPLANYVIMENSVDSIILQYQIRNGTAEESFKNNQSFSSKYSKDIGWLMESLKPYDANEV